MRLGSGKLSLQGWSLVFCLFSFVVRRVIVCIRRDLIRVLWRNFGVSWVGPWDRARGEERNVCKRGSQNGDKVRKRCHWKKGRKEDPIWWMGWRRFMWKRDLLKWWNAPVRHLRWVDVCIRRRLDEWDVRDHRNDTILNTYRLRFQAAPPRILTFSPSSQFEIMTDTNKCSARSCINKLSLLQAKSIVVSREYELL